MMTTDIIDVCHDVEQYHKFQYAPVPIPIMLHSEQKCAHLCSEWSIVGYRTRAWWDLWIRSIGVTASLMSLMASLVTTSRMQQCFNVLIDSYQEFLLLFYCCVLLEIKLTTTTTTSGGSNTWLMGKPPFTSSDGKSTAIYIKHMM